jgi:hypothetical protein
MQSTELSQYFVFSVTEIWEMCCEIKKIKTCHEIETILSESYIAQMRGSMS